MTDINKRIEDTLTPYFKTYTNRPILEEKKEEMEECKAKLKSLFKEMVEEAIGEAKPEVFGHCTEHRKGSYSCNPCLYIGIGKQLVDKYENSMRLKLKQLLGGKDK